MKFKEGDKVKYTGSGGWGTLEKDDYAIFVEYIGKFDCYIKDLDEHNNPKWHVGLDEIEPYDVPEKLPRIDLNYDSKIKYGLIPPLPRFSPLELAELGRHGYTTSELIELREKGLL